MRAEGMITATQDIAGLQRRNAEGAKMEQIKKREASHMEA